jgi:hypothetical protein
LLCYKFSVFIVVVIIFEQRKKIMKTLDLVGFFNRFCFSNKIDKFRVLFMLSLNVIKIY